MPLGAGSSTGSHLRSARAQRTSIAAGTWASVRALSLANASLCTTSSRAAATARQCDRHNTQQAGLRSSHFAPLARSLLIIVVATSEYASVTPHHSLLIIHHGDPIPWPFRGSPSSYGPPASCRLGQGEAAWPNTCTAVLCHIGQVTSGQSWPVPYGASIPGAHAHDPHPGLRSGLGLSGARGVKRVHDGRRSLEQRPPRRAAAQPRLGRLKRRFHTAQKLVRDELDR